MAQNYTRQSSFADGDTITASLFNNEYNQLVNAFAYSSTDASATGHRHDGSIGQGGNISQIGDLNFNNKIVVDDVNNRWGFFVEVAAASVEQIRLQDGSIIPVTTNDIDLGSASLQFKDAYFDGTVNADSLVLSSGATVTAVLDEDAMTSNSATALATQQSIKAYVDAQVTAQDLDFQGDTGGALSIDLDSETLTIAGGTGIDTSGATNTLTVSIDSTVATLTGTQTLTNKTISASDITVGTGKTLDVSAGTLTLADNQISGDKVEGGTIASTTITSLASTTIDTTNLEVTNLKAKDGTAAGSIADTTGVVTLASSVLTTTDINGGTIDGTTIGGTTAAAGSFTTVSASGNITVGGTVDGRDVATDGTKLDGIEAGADVTDTANVTAAGALMDSELTNITAVKALNQGVATTDSPTFAGATLTTADINGGTIDGTVIGGSSAAAGSFTTISASGEITANGGVAFGDNDKATFGASDDLQIYHNGSHSLIQDTGTGNLFIDATDLRLRSYSGEQYLQANENDAVTIYYDNSAKLATTSTGIDVTGTVTADGLTVDGASALNNSISVTGDITVNRSGVLTRGLEWNRGGIIDAAIKLHDDEWVRFDNFFDNGFEFRTGASGVEENKLIIAPSGDISFYEDTGTTAKFFWDASAESLGIGTTSPAARLDLGAYTGGLLNTNILAAQDGWINVKTSSAVSGSRYEYGGSGYYGRTYANAFGFNIDTDTSAVPIIISTNGTERLRIDSSGRVGINTSSPQDELHIEANYPQLRIASNLNVLGSNNLVATVDGYATNGLAWRIGRVFGSADLQINNERASATVFTTDATERMRIDSSGNVGIGTSSPSDKLHITGGSPSLRLEGTGGIGGYHLMSSEGSNNYILTFDADAGGSNGQYKFLTSGTERMRIDSSGNLLVGTTDAAVGVGNTNTGSAFGGSTGYGCFSRTGAAAQATLYLNKNTNDGAIASFQKDGTAVGSIGTEVADATTPAELVITAGTVNAARLWLKGGDSGLILDGHTNSVLPTDEDSYEDARTTLGSSSYRFKDLYLSGGVYLGGTGAANHLDDYEEGQWTPEYAGTTTAGVGTYTFQEGSYIKVGNLVTVNGYFRSTAHTGTGNIYISNLPFTVSAGNDEYGVLNIGECFNLAKSADTVLTGYASPNSTYITLRQITTAATTTSTSSVPMDTGFDILFTCTYRTV